MSIAQRTQGLGLGPTSQQPTDEELMVTYDPSDSSIKNLPSEMTTEAYIAWREQQARRDTKYHATPVEIDGIRFDSTAEGRRYWELRRMEDAGEIRDLELQPVFPLIVNGVAVANYRADFRYVDAAGIVHVEDVKGVRTPVYRLKAKMVRAIYGIGIEEVRGDD